jgi:hypothetical protein
MLDANDVVLQDTDGIIITLQPNFSLMDYDDDDVDDNFTIIEYGNLPLHVQREVIGYFNSNDFIRNQAEDITP